VGGSASKPTREETVRDLHRESQALLKYARQLRLDSTGHEKDKVDGRRSRYSSNGS
jgi:hypothetical protein